MGILGTASRLIAVALVGAALVACYEPTLRDCTVSCSAATDCAPEQRCHRGWCAAPSATCTGDDGGDDDVDAGVDDPPIDARVDARVDAPPTNQLRIEVKGRGRVDADHDGVTCAGPDGDCRFDLASGTVVVLTAIDQEDSFDRWREACDGEGATCTLTLDASITRAKAEFE